MKSYIVTFFTHFDAIQCDRALREQGIAVELSPVPRILSSSCGTCARFAWNEDPIPLVGEFEQLFQVEGEHYALLEDHR